LLSEFAADPSIQVTQWSTDPHGCTAESLSTQGLASASTLAAAVSKLCPAESLPELAQVWVAHLELSTEYLVHKLFAHQITFDRNNDIVFLGGLAGFVQEPPEDEGQVVCQMSLTLKNEMGLEKQRATPFLPQVLPSSLASTMRVRFTSFDWEEAGNML
jgi:hypothetical protein